jgi:hypothetical protein
VAACRKGYRENAGLEYQNLSSLRSLPKERFDAKIGFPRVQGA